MLAAMNALKEAGAVQKRGKLMVDGLMRRNVFLGDLRQATLWTTLLLSLMSLPGSWPFIIAVCLLACF